MQVILLSGGSGKRLWPLSNNVKSKQFLRLLPTSDGSKESMIQRVVRQINESGIADSITVATGRSQMDSIISQLGADMDVVLESERRDTFPAIALATSYLKTKGVKEDEAVVVMPCDVYTDEGYFRVLKRMADCVENGDAELVLMGIKPAYPSSKFGYILPAGDISSDSSMRVKGFKEKPDEQLAQKLIAEGALWNGGVFAFRLGYLIDKILPYFQDTSFEYLNGHYGDFPKISFDYEVVEKAKSIAVVPFEGNWKDLGTWNALVAELPYMTEGNAIANNDVEDTTIINELDIPIVCTGVKNMVVVASPDGILVSGKEESEKIKGIVDKIDSRPLCEERRWGWYKVIGQTSYPDGQKSLTKILHLNMGCCISYQRHSQRDEVWTVVDGQARLIVDDIVTEVGRGHVAVIRKGQKHAIKAVTDVEIIEVQTGTELVEEDIERFEYHWA